MIDNPYLDYIEETYPKAQYYPGPPVTYEGWIMARDIGVRGTREHEVKKYSWAIPDEAAILKIAEHNPIVEMGAGAGYWAYLLRQLGVDIIAYDMIPPNGTPWPDDTTHGSHAAELGINWYHRGHTTWTEVIKGTPRMLKQHADRTLFLCWPTMDKTAYQCLQAYKGDTVIYVGEHEGGCNADIHFFRKLEREYTEVYEYGIPQWAGIHDYMTIWERN